MTKLIIIVGLAMHVARGANDTNSSYADLERAKYYAHLYNWAAAVPLFDRAQQHIPATDPSNRLYAHVGTLRLGGLNNRPATQRSQEIADLLAQNPLLKAVSDLQLFAWTVKGDLDGEVDPAAARADWTEVVTLSKELHQSEWLYRAEGQLGFCDFYDGDIPSAQRKVASALLQAIQAHDIGAEVFYLSTSAYGLALQNVLPQNASEYAQKAIEIARQHPDVGIPHLANTTLVKLLVNTGKIAEAAQMAADLLKTPNLAPNALSNYLSAAATVAVAKHDSDEAIADYDRAISAAEELGDTRTVADLRAALATLYLTKGNVQMAEQVSRQAIDQLGKAGTLPLLPSRLDAFAQILIAEKKYSEAAAVYDRAESIVDSLVGRGNSFITKTAPIAGADQLYAHHFALLVDILQDSDAGFSVVEQGRARALVDLILSQRAYVNQSTDKHLTRLRIDMAGLRSRQDIQKQREAIFLAEQENLANPGLTVIAREHFRAVSAEMMQKRLNDSEVLLEYILASPTSYVVALTRDSRQAIPLAGRDTIETAAQHYIAAVQKHAPAMTEAAVLFKLLLAPVPQHLRDSVFYTVIPDGHLSQLPFDALLDGREYVVQHHVLSYAPSATTLYLLRTKEEIPGRHSNALLAVGGIPYESSTRMNQVAVERGYSQTGKFFDLPSSGPEIEAALRAIPRSGNRKLTGQAATEQM